MTTTTTTFDFAPLYRHAVGFDRVANMAQQLVQQQLAAKGVSATNTIKRPVASGKRAAGLDYPRYNISQLGELDYQITLALAGFSLDEVEIMVTANELQISGKKQPLEQTSTVLHQGINLANFERKFALADHVQVVGADMVQGLLTINLQREVPEALKSRKITIGG